MILWAGVRQLKFKTPPAAGSDELSFVIYGDMGKAPLDPSVEHYIQVDGNIFESELAGDAVYFNQ